MATNMSVVRVPRFNRQNLKRWLFFVFNINMLLQLVEIVNKLLYQASLLLIFFLLINIIKLMLFET